MSAISSPSYVHSFASVSTSAYSERFLSPTVQKIYSFVLGRSLLNCGIQSVEKCLSKMYVALLTVIDRLDDLIFFLSERGHEIRRPGENIPVGIRNLFNVCWASALFQVMTNSPEMQRICTAQGELAILQQLIGNYHRGQREGKAIAEELDMQQLRRLLYFEEDSSYKDARKVLIRLLTLFPSLQRSSHMAFIPLLYDLSENRSFAELIEWRGREDLDELLVPVYRRREEAQTIDVEEPIRASLQLERIGSGGNLVTYSCISFVVFQHSHFITYKKSNGVWWLCNDKRIRRASLEEIEEKLPRADIYHYQKNN